LNDSNIPKIEFLGITPSEIQNGGQPRMIHRWQITLPDHLPFLIEGFPEDHVQHLQEQIQYLQKQYPESFLGVNEDEGKLFSDKFLQEEHERIEEIRRKALSDVLFA
jgi:hypothetical protein